MSRIPFSQGRWKLSQDGTHHVCSNLRFLTGKTQSVPPEETMYQGYEVKRIGSTSIFAEAADGSCQQIDLKDVLYIPNYQANDEKIPNLVVARAGLSLTQIDAATGKCFAEFDDDSGKRVQCLAWDNGSTITLQLCTNEGCKSVHGHVGQKG